MGLVTGSRWSGSDRSPPGTFFLGRAGETGEQVITLITLRNLRPGKLPLARDGSCRTKLCNPCPLTTTLHMRFFVFHHRTARRRSCIHIYTSSSSSLLFFLSHFPRVQACGVSLALFSVRAKFMSRDSSWSNVRPARYVCCCASASGVYFLLFVS